MRRLHCIQIRQSLSLKVYRPSFHFRMMFLKTAESASPFAFEFDHTEQIIMNDKQIGCDISLSLGEEDEKNYHALFGNMPIYCNLGTAELNLNTLSGDVSAKVLVNVAMLCDGMGLELQWKEWSWMA